MGAFISYLYLAHRIRNFFVLAPNLTIYNKHITDFTPNTNKYVFRSVAEFACGAYRLSSRVLTRPEDALKAVGLQATRRCPRLEAHVRIRTVLSHVLSASGHSLRGSRRTSGGTG